MNMIKDELIVLIYVEPVACFKDIVTTDYLLLELAQFNVNFDHIKADYGLMICIRYCDLTNPDSYYHFVKRDKTMSLLCLKEY